MTKRISILIIIVAIIIIGVLVYTSQKPGEEKEVIKIGVILPLSGSAANYGTYVKNGLEIAEKEINNPNLKLVYEDDQADPKLSVTAYHKLKNIDEVKIIIGTGGSPATLAVAQLAEKDKVLLIAPIAAAESLSEAGDYIFRNHSKSSDEMRVLADFLSKNNYKNIAIIYDNSNDAFVQGRDYLKQYLEEKNILVADYSIFGNQGSYKTELIKLKNNSDTIDGIYISSKTNDAVILTKELKELDINKTIFADKGAVGNIDFVKNAKELSENIIFTESYYAQDVNQSFWDKHKEMYNNDPNIISTQGYDILNIIYKIIENKCDKDNIDCIKNELYEVRNYKGAGGNISIDDNGDFQKNIVIKTIKNGQFVPYD